MSATIDERVVEMRFDNRNFEKNVKTSMSTLDKLKKSLNLKGTSDGLEEISKATKKVDFNLMSKGVDAVKVKFSALEVVAMTTLSRIANSAITTGKNLVSAFTIDPVKTGLQEYETQINAVQTILANTKNKGSTLNDVNNALNELNKYADLTIYNFTEMTRNIGTFTAAGVGLKESTTAIQGIANLAAVSGSNAQQASTAMYQLSQALAAGSVKLQDWNSVVNAGMGGEIFQEALKKTARVHGIAVDDMIKKAGSFRESLQKGWITSEVLTETLAKMTKSGAAEYLSKLTGISQSQIEATQVLVDKNEDGNASYEQLAETLAKTGKIAKQDAIDILEMADTATDAATKVKTFTQLMDTLKEAAQSGWTQTWQLIIGDFEESKALFTEASDYFGGLIEKASTARNRLLGGALNNVVSMKDWKKLQNSGKATKNFQNLLVAVAKDHNVAIESMIAAEGNFANTLKDGWLTADIYNEAIRYMTDAEKKLVKQEAASIDSKKERIKYTKKLTAEIKKADKPYSDLVEKMNRPSGRELLIDSVRNSIKTIATEISGVKKAWAQVFPKTTSEDLYNIINRLHDFSVYLTKIDEDGSKLGRSFRGLFSVLHIVSNLVGGTFKIGLKVVQTILSHFNLDILDVTASIGDALYKFDKWIDQNKYIEKSVDAVITVIEKFVKGVKEIPQVQNGITTFDNVLTSIFTSFGERAKETSKRIDEFIERVRTLDHISLDNIDDVFKDFYDNVLSYMFDFGGIFTSAKSKFEELRASLTSNLNDSDSKLKWFKDTVIGYAGDLKNRLDGFDIFGSLLTIGTGALVFKTAKKILGIFEAIGGFAKTLKAPLNALTEALNNLQPVLKSYAFKLKAEGIKSVAIAIAILAGSIAVLSKCDPENLRKAAISLAIVSGALAALCAVLGRFSTVSIGKVSTAMIAISGSLLILVNALKKMENLEIDGIQERLLILGEIALGLLVFGGIASIIPGLNKSVISILAFAVALRIMINALQKINDLNLENSEEAVKTLIGVVSAMGVLSLACRGLSLKSTAGLMLIAVSLRMFVNTIDKLCEFDFSKIQNGIKSLVVIFGLFAGMIVASKFAGENAAKAGVMMLTISVSLLIMAKAIKKIGKLSEHDVEKGAGAVAGLLLVFAAVVAMSKFAGEHAAKAGVMLLAMSGTFLAVSVAMAILGRLKDDQVSRALKAIAGISACFAALIAASGLSKDCKSNIMAMTVAFGALAIALGALSFIDPERLKSSTIAMSSVIGMFAVLTASTYLTKGDAVKPLLAMSGAIAIISGMIFLIGQLPVQNAIGAAGSISILLATLTASLFVISKMQSINMKSIGALYAVSGTVAILATIIGVMSALDVNPSIESALALSTLLLAMSASCVILSTVGSAAGQALIGAAALDGVLAILGAFVIGIGALFSQDFMSKGKEYMEKGFDILNTLAYGLGSFVGNLIGGFTDGAMSGLPAIGTYLSQFATNVQGFLDCIGDLDPSIATSAKNLALALLSICAAELLETITGWLTGTSDMVEFGAKLNAFGQGIADFSEVVKGNVDGTAVEAATNAGKLIIELAKSVPNSGGLIGLLAGNNEIDEFGSKLKTFAQGLVDFSEVVKGGIDKSSVETATNAGKLITELASSVPNSGGLIATITGDNNIEDFSTKLGIFGQGIVDFSEKVKGKIDPASVEAATNAGLLITGLAKSVPNSGGWLGKIFGDNDIKDFGDKLNGFGEGLAAFCTGEISKVPLSSLRLTINELSAIMQLLQNVSATNTGNINAFNKSLKDVAKTSINGFLEEFSESSSKVTSAINSFFNVALNSVKNFNLQFYTAGNNATSGFINGLKLKVNNGDVYGAGFSIGAKALEAAKKALDEHSPSKKMAKVGSYAIDGFIKGLTTSGVKIDTVTNAVFTKFVATATNVTNVTKNAKGIITSYAKNYVKNTKNVTKSTKEATKAIQAYSTMIYKQSSYYKEDKKNIEGHLKELKKYYSERDKLNAKLAKAKNKNDKKNIQNSIKENKKNIETMKKQIDKDQKQMVTNAKKALNEVKKEIKNAVKDYVSIFNASVGSINLFGDVELTGKKAIKSNIKDSLLELTALSNFSLDSGINFLEKFSSSVENLADTVQSATDEVTESKEELTNAENELREAQAKSLAVNGRSQKYLDQIAEAETKVAEAKQKVVEAEEKLASITKGSSQEMLENMKSNVEAFDAWQSDLEKLSKMDISKDLLAHLKGLGISGAEQVSAFVKMTKEELVKANEYWEKYSSMSSKTLIDSIKDKSQAMTEWSENIEKFSKLNIDNTVKVNLIQEFETQGIDSAEYIKQLLSMSESELNDFVSSYKQMTEIPEKVAANVAKSIDEVNKKTDNSKTIINNYLDLMRENLNAEKEYESNLKKLKKNGISDGLYEQLVESGDKSLIASFAKASKSDIKEANKIYAEASKESANQWLESYGDSISDAEKWNKNMKKLTKLNIPKKMKESLYEEFKEKGIEGNNILEIILGFDKKQLQDFISKYKKSGNVVNSVTNDIMAGSATVSVETQELINKSAKDSADKAMNAYNKAIKDNEAKIKKTSKDVGKTVVKSIDKHANKKTLEPLGKNVCIGLANGIKNNKSIAINEAVVMAKETINKSKKTLKINSPSKVFMEFGKYCDEGLAIGLTKYASLASDASESIGDDTISNMQNSINKISAWANSGIESEPTIRPVLDMSELQRQAGSIGGMFNAQAISVNADMAAGISNRMYNASGSQNGSTTNNSYDQSTQTINNTFNITGDNPKEIANEVSKILQHQVNRRSVTWA